MSSSTSVSDAILTQILAKLDSLQVSQQLLQAKVCAILTVHLDENISLFTRCVTA